MEAQACLYGRKSVASAHNATKVSDFGFVNDDFVLIVISFLIMYLF